MKRPRTHIEMLPVDLHGGWHTLAGFPPGLEVKVLADDLDESARSGARTRLVRFAPGAATHSQLVHAYWEEAYVLSGDLYALADTPGRHANTPSYSCRPPGTPHGPFASAHGCVLFEVQYFMRRQHP